MSLITGNKVKKKHTSQGIVKKKRTKPHFVDQKMYFRDCKTLCVFERKIPLTLEFRFHQE
jgi:hypothetical protein